MVEFHEAIPQITKNYREFVQHVINIGGEFIELKKRYKLIFYFLCGNIILTLLSIGLIIYLICAKG